MKTELSRWGKLIVLGAALSAALAPSCKSEVAGDGDGDGATNGDGDDVVETGGTGGQVAETGGLGGMVDLGSGGQDGTGGTVENPLALPDLLSETGLYEADMVTLAEGVRPFRPQFALWTDGAKKRRWVYLPEGETIDTSDMDYWELPIGTKLWKEFERDGKVIETRLLERKFNGVWVMVAYQWRDDGSDADKVVLGQEDASGTDHDIPSEEQCWQCHNQVPGRAIGFSAVQLAHDAGLGVGGAPAQDEWTLDQLEAEGWLSDTPPSIDVPGDEVQLRALGYLHANCGHCHHPRSSVSGRVDMELWLPVGELGSVEETPTYLTTFGVDSALSGEGPVGSDKRIRPSDVATSSVYTRFNTLGETYSMPPLGTEVVDPEGEAAIREWIDSVAP